MYERVGAQNPLFAVYSTFPSHSRGEELIIELQRSLIEMSFGRDIFGVKFLTF